MDQIADGSEIERAAAALSRPPPPGSARIGRSGARGPAATGGMRITYRIFLVGGIPITIAAAIALAALVLLNEADRARSGAVLAGTIYRNLLSARTARDDFLETTQVDRTRFYELFLSYAEQARFDLKRLADVVRDPDHVRTANDAEDALKLYGDHMRRFIDVTLHNDGLIAEMADRADSLVRLTDQARERQHESNADIVMSLTEGDRKLRVARDIVDRTQELSAAVSAVQLLRARGEGPGTSPQGGRPSERWSFGLAHMRSAEAALSASLVAAGRDRAARDLGRLYVVYEMSIAPVSDAVLAAEAMRSSTPPGEALSDWLERLLKIYSTEQRTLHDEVADLLTYSVQASETEQATQNIAIEALKLGNRTADALASRDTTSAEKILVESRTLSSTVESLPISPLIQSEMIDAIDQWRQGLATTIEGLNAQNRIISEMDTSAANMVESARFLDAMLTRNAERIGALVRNVLIFGAATGLLLGSLTGLAVARSITRPLQRLQSRMMELAENSEAGPIADFDRRDELGDMARATNVFITEIGRRERALRKSKDRADAALAELQKTQTDLIQAEKLASLGQLVAGVAHEINTPLGIALTTATLLGDESKRFSEAAASGRLQRSVLERFVERMREGTQLLFTNLTRAADLVHSFKQVAADQASGERRRFEMDEWLQDLLTSLSPVLRKTKHSVSIECPPGLTVDTYPGALGQVLTNLLVNAVAHAYSEGQAGKLSIRVSEPAPDSVRIVFSDDGKGIPPENIGKVFDPFFTTGRSTGSTGLGLHIVYNLVTSRLQGRIGLYSRLGKGTRFSIDIPKVPAEAQPEAAPERRKQLEGA
jgi:signal transduction histidine kinase